MMKTTFPFSFAFIFNKHIFYLLIFIRHIQKIEQSRTRKFRLSLLLMNDLFIFTFSSFRLQSLGFHMQFQFTCCSFPFYFLLFRIFRIMTENFLAIQLTFHRLYDVHVSMCSIQCSTVEHSVESTRVLYCIYEQSSQKSKFQKLAFFWD